MYLILKLFFSIITTCIVARWIYAEAKLAAPTVVSTLEYGLDLVEIPTHDKWDEETKESMKFYTQSAVNYIKNEKDDIRSAVGEKFSSVLSGDKQSKNKPLNMRTFGGAIEHF